MKQYPGEKQIIRAIVSAYRSSVKYHDTSSELNLIHSISNKMGKNPVGNWRQAASEIANQLKDINDTLASHDESYDPHYINTAIANASSISRLSDKDNPSQLFNGIALSVWLALKDHDYFNTPILEF